MLREPHTIADSGRPHTIVFGVLLALVSTAVAYRFGSGHQQEQIPLILKQLDPAYLANDFFVSTSLEFGPRFYFAHLVAWISQALSVAWTYAALTFLSDLALVVVTLWAARRIVGACRLGSAIAAVLTVAVSAFRLGDATDLRYDVFQPASLAMPGMLLALAFGWMGRPIPAAVSASIAGLSHPLYGVQGGAIAIVTAFVALLLPTGDKWPGLHQVAWRKAIPPTVMGTAVLGASTLVLWWWPYQQGARLAPLPTDEFFDILGRFRSPHHWLPSQFRPEDWVTTAVFCIASFLAFDAWSRTSRRTARVLLVPAFLVGIGCVVGTLLTEIWPLKIALTLQPFRLLSIVKWTGFLLIGWLLGRYWKSPTTVLERPIVGMSLLSAAGTFPLVTAAGLFLMRFRTWLPRRVDPRLWVAALALAAVSLWLNFGSFDERVRLVSATSTLVLLFQSRRILRVAGPVVVLVFVVAVVFNRPVTAGATSPLQFVFSVEDLQDADARMARTVARQTPPDAVVIVPPNFGVLRFVGQRAVVVDFKSVPLQEWHLREWRERIRQVYGDVEGGGVVASRRLEDAWRGTTDARLQELALRFGATHAVLFAETPTGLPPLAVDNTYRLVSLRTAN